MDKGGCGIFSNNSPVFVYRSEEDDEQMCQDGRSKVEMRKGIPPTRSPQSRRALPC
jgi:hypothetical protein